MDAFALQHLLQHGAEGIAPVDANQNWTGGRWKRLAGPLHEGCEAEKEGRFHPEFRWRLDRREAQGGEQVKQRSPGEEQKPTRYARSSH